MDDPDRDGTEAGAEECELLEEDTGADPWTDDEDDACDDEPLEYEWPPECPECPKHPVPVSTTAKAIIVRGSMKSLQRSFIAASLVEQGPGHRPTVRRPSRIGWAPRTVRGQP